jgi:O-antigen biosynthesis protein WbqP
MSDLRSTVDSNVAGALIDLPVSEVVSRFGRAKRAFDLIVSLLLLPLAGLLMLFIGVLVRLTSRGPVLYWSDRVGQHNVIFRMPKFRTMRIDTPQLATHLLRDPKKFLTPVGAFLRKTSLDELPQLWSVVKGDLSLVGPRPALFNQDDLVAMRTERGVHSIRPGLTGWAQVNGRDELSIPDKVQLDTEYLQNRSFALDLRILSLTVLKVYKADGILH